MKIQTFSIVAGTDECNAICPYCISRMTPKQGITFKEPKVNWRNFKKACRLAQVSGVTSVLITGKGEPTLYPEQITKFLKNMQKFDFPLIELQTNCIALAKEFAKYKNYLKEWYELGLTMIAVSIAHYNKKRNREIFTQKAEYIDFEDAINKLHNIGFSVRLSCVLVKDYIDSVEEVRKLVDCCRKWRVEQLSIRKLAYPFKAENKKTNLWVRRHLLSQKSIEKIKAFLENEGNKLMTLPAEAVVYDINGQNICLTDALTIKPETDSLRQIIFFPDGHLRYDWQFKGAVLI